MSHRTGRRDLVVYDREDPDRACEVVKLNDEEADALVELLGAPRIVQRLNQAASGGRRAGQPPAADSSHVPVRQRPMGDARVRTRTGASIVAIVRAGQVFASPGPDFVLAAGDIVVVVGSADSTSAVADILADG